MSGVVVSALRPRGPSACPPLPRTSVGVCCLASPLCGQARHRWWWLLGHISFLSWSSALLLILNVSPSLAGGVSQDSHTQAHVAEIVPPWHDS